MKHRSSAETSQRSISKSRRTKSINQAQPRTFVCLESNTTRTWMWTRRKSRASKTSWIATQHCLSSARKQAGLPTVASAMHTLTALSSIGYRKTVSLFCPPIPPNDGSMTQHTRPLRACCVNMVVTISTPKLTRFRHRDSDKPGKLHRLTETHRSTKQVATKMSQTKT